MIAIITQLKAAINDSSLQKIGEIRLSFNVPSGTVPFIDISGSRDADGNEIFVTLKSVDGNERFTLNSDGSTSLLSALILGASQKRVFFSQGTYEVSLLNKYALQVLNSYDLSAVGMKPTDFNFLPVIKNLTLAKASFNTDLAFENCDKLTEVSFSGDTAIVNLSDFAKIKSLEKVVLANGSAIRGDIGGLSSQIKYISILSCNNVIGALSGLSNNTELTYLKLSRTGVSGDIAALSGLKNLTDLSVEISNITGDIASLGGCTSLTNLVTSDSKITGSIENLITAFRQNGRASGSIRYDYAGTEGEITYAGLPLKSWVSANLGVRDVLITWDSTSISITGA